MPSLRLAVICDFPEEGWHSMDLCGEMLLRELRSAHADAVQAERVCPPFRRCFGQLPLLGRGRRAFNVDRLLNRFWTFPRHLRTRLGDFDCYHVCDHSYAHLVHVLPAEQTGVYCHDLDAFRCLIEPQQKPRPFWFKAMARRTLQGLQKAAWVFVNTREVASQLEAHQLVDPAKIVLAPLGTAPEFSPQPAPADRTALPRELSDAPYLLHVGSCIARKRIDVLLNVFADVRRRHPSFHLIKVGGPWQPEQAEQLRQLGLSKAVTQLVGLDRCVVAALYRGAALTLLPSEAEGFGLPVLEALACGSVVVASDLPAVREVGGEAVVYCPMGDVSRWVETVDGILSGNQPPPPRAVRLARAERFSWRSHATTILSCYEQSLASAPGAACGLAIGQGRRATSGICAKKVGEKA
jgi:glycosyltransferase involved in cell wall biosynthesis